MRPEIKKLGPMCVQSRNAAGELEVAIMPAFAAGGPLPKHAGRAPQAARKTAAKRKAQPKQPAASRAKLLPSIALPPELLPPAPVSTAPLSRALPCASPTGAPSGEGIRGGPSLTASVVQLCIQAAQQRAEVSHASAMLAGVTHTQPEAVPTSSGAPLLNTANASSIALVAAAPAASPTAALIPEQTHAGGLQVMEESEVAAELPLLAAVWLPTPEASVAIPAATAEPISSLVAPTEGSTARDPLWAPPGAEVVGAASMAESAVESLSCLPAAMPVGGISDGASADVHAVHESPAEAVPSSVPQALSLAAGESVYVAAQGLSIAPLINEEYARVNAARSLVVDPSQMQV